jgi:hypothetical protein
MGSKNQNPAIQLIKAVQLLKLVAYRSSITEILMTISGVAWGALLELLKLFHITQSAVLAIKTITEINPWYNAARNTYQSKPRSCA